MRHSTAVHLLRADVDIFTISQWLGHASVTTTNRYATIDIEMKRKAIEKAQAIEHANDGGAALWRKDASILTWLESLCRFHHAGLGVTTAYLLRARFLYTWRLGDKGRAISQIRPDALQR